MISIHRLSKEFLVSAGRVAALKQLDLEVAEGEFFVIVGASGSGKTTLLRCVAGLEVPTGGEIRIADQVVSSDNPPTWIPSQQRGLGMVFQSYAVWPHLTVYDNVALPLLEGAQRVPRSQVRDRVREALRLVQLEELEGRSATLLSGGQQQRVALARAVAVSSKLLLMDEPLSNLDARLREEVRGKIRDLAKQLGATVLYVTHDQIEAMAMADRIALMQSGELLQVGVPMELYRRPARAQVAEFFGFVNWIRGTVTDAKLAETGIGKLTLPGDARGGDEVLLGFRPECLSVLTGFPPSIPNVFSGEIKSSTFLGDQFVFEAVVGAQSFVGKSRSIPTRNEGHLYLHVDPADLMVFPSHEKTGLSAYETKPAAALSMAV